MNILTINQLRNKHQKEIDNFEGIFFAFNREQFEKGVEKIGLKDGEKVVNIGFGGYLKKSRVQDWVDMFKRHKKEKKERLKNEKLLIDALVYELNNYEYCSSNDIDAVLNALQLDDVDPKILNKAINIYNDNLINV